MKKRKDRYTSKRTRELQRAVIALTALYFPCLRAQRLYYESDIKFDIRASCFQKRDN